MIDLCSLPDPSHNIGEVLGMPGPNDHLNESGSEQLNENRGLDDVQKKMGKYTDSEASRKPLLHKGDYPVLRRLVLANCDHRLHELLMGGAKKLTTS
jgi:hypothetical protein